MEEKGELGRERGQGIEERTEMNIKWKRGWETRNGSENGEEERIRNGIEGRVRERERGQGIEEGREMNIKWKRGWETRNGSENGNEHKKMEERMGDKE
jgi:hypothetical protein